jgi:hypothetical protein
MKCDCGEDPECPDATDPDALRSRVRTGFPEHGCSMLCNGVLLFDDGTLVLPGGTA